MKKALFVIATLFVLSACSQYSIDPVDTVSKPPKTTCGGAECEDDQ
jgi:PBP1b-binding outer membrane lipoprotein LpoB